MSDGTETLGTGGDPARDTDGGQGRPPRWRLAVTVAVGVAGGLVLASLVEAVVGRLQPLLLALVISLFLSFAMEPAVQHLARRGIRRGLGTALVFLVAALLAIGFVAAMAPLVSSQIRTLVREGPQLLDRLADQARDLPGGLGESVSGWLEGARASLPRRLPGLAGGLVGLGTTLLGGLIQGLTVLLVTFYLVAEGPRLRRALVTRLEPDLQLEVLAVWELAVAKTGGYVYSRVLTAVVSAAVHVLVFVLIGLDFAAALGVYVGVVSSLIPVIGTYLAGALPVLIALTDSAATALLVLLTVAVYQQVENYLVAPRITRHTMALHPAVAIVSVLAGGALLGAVGALLALPAAAIATALVSAYGERHDLVAHELLTDVDPRVRRRARAGT